MAQLKRDVQALRGRLAQAGETNALKIHVDEGQVQVLLQVGSCTKECVVLYLSADDYPNSQMMGMCNNDNELNSKLEGLSEQFEYGASIEEVLQQVVGLAGVDLQAIQAGQDAGASGDEAMDQGGESDGDDSSEGSDGPDLYEEGNDERTKEVLQKTSRWDTVEQGKQQADDMAAEAAARLAGQSLSALSMQEQLAKQRQLFSPQEAYTMLAKELKEMMLHPCNGVAVDAVDYNAWQWVMWLEEFEEGSELEKELKQLRKRHGLGSVQLRVTFKRGLHPFYPPLVELLRPRLIGPIPGALSSHPVTQLGKWDPWRTIRALAAQVKMFLQLAARVDAESPMNDPARHPESAYLPVEQQLARLEALSGAVPLCLPANRELYSARDAGVDAQRLEAMARDAKRPKMGTEDMGGKKKTVWASGVGYGHDHGGGADDIWNASAAEAAQAAHDAELQKLLDDFTAGLRQQLGPVLANDSSMETDELDQAELQLCMEALESSCLLPFLDQQLSQASFSDMASRAGYYTSLLSVASCLCCHPLAHLLTAPMRPASEQGASSSSATNLHSILLGLAGQARHFSRVVQHEERPEKQPAAAAEALGPSTTMPAAVAAAAAAKEAEEERGMLDLAQLIQSTADASAAVVAGQGPAASGVTQSGDPSKLRDPEEVYKATLQPLQFDTVSAYTKGDHIFFEKLAKEGTRSRPRMVRIGKEMAGAAPHLPKLLHSPSSRQMPEVASHNLVAGIGSSLPLARGSSIFVRVDEQNVQLWKALITGPTDTPYGYGCFEFDMYFPTGYPNSPPSVQIRTTGGGSVRFNPNLYKCGKVCLSLLGTWSGARGESWDPVASSMLQVLISISSLILVEHPYYNEPGYESSYNTPSGQAESRKYTANIREQTLHWAIFQQLKSPSPGFEEVIKAHFRLQKNAIEQQCDTWIQEADGAAAKRMRSHLNSWLALLPNL